VLDKIKPGSKIAIGVGSRGIASLPKTINALVELLIREVFSPFIFPAMSSHGGGTFKGQKLVLESLGVTEEAMKCPILSSMSVEEIAKITYFALLLGTPIVLTIEQIGIFKHIYENIYVQRA